MNKSKLTTQNRGKIAELKVASELLSRGYEVYTPLSDVGIDLLVLKKNLVPCFIQVKYSKWFPRAKCYWQVLSTKSFNRVTSDRTFCIFLLEDKYLIVPYRFIQKHDKSLYEKTKKNERYVFKFKIINGKMIENRSKIDFSKFLNNWETLES